jgi:hypothetical protein
MAMRRELVRQKQRDCNYAAPDEGTWERKVRKESRENDVRFLSHFCSIIFASLFLLLVHGVHHHYDDGDQREAA